ncbi:MULTISPECIES: prepilin-type N-terminal cleavage/methylation domain-containing protein [Methylosinus]|uniref:Type II secretion system protein GspH n=1 Tax=Methylosinus trichosporium (strain ATCC 35070 / NCIMB 11131 / UNIQEM 75 / OB3b) TaxID=595536 RepID=A0A2D2CV19_METT3|nr:MULTISPECIES: GspH/FimT family pseudopilin [Methylosinus]ATQ66520.1 type II secretion system protein GspH [Methylosinus trichosporium OB3b]OBS52639.1 type II secretion system protein GspH [Methylosinus sp. 3S-1]
MSRRAPTGSSARAGFSLIEMLAALAILALVAGLATQLGRRPSPRLRVESAARSLCAALRQTRMRAIAANEEMALTVDLRRKTFFSPTVGEKPLPNDAQINLTVSAIERRSRDKADFAFYPSGGSSGGEMSIALPGVRAQIAVNWLTGATRCAVF